MKWSVGQYRQKQDHHQQHLLRIAIHFQPFGESLHRAGASTQLTLSVEVRVGATKNTCKVRSSHVFCKNLDQTSRGGRKLVIGLFLGNSLQIWDALIRTGWVYLHNVYKLLNSKNVERYSFFPEQIVNCKNASTLFNPSTWGLEQHWRKSNKQFLKIEKCEEFIAF